MAKFAAPPPQAPETPDEPDAPDPADYVPLTKAMEALHRLHDDPEFRKTPAAVEVAYALGAIEEDVWGGIGESARASARKEEALERILQFLPAIMSVTEQWLKLIRPSDPIASIYSDPFVMAGTHPMAEVYEKEGCQPIGGTPADIGGVIGGTGNVVRGWGCCACWKREGGATYNGDQRPVCKVCGHTRCGKAADLPSGAT